MDDEDATLLDMTKTRLSLLRMEDSNLQKLLLKSIARNFRFYAHNDIEEQNLENLPNTLRNELLEEFSHHLKSEDLRFSKEEFSLRLAMFRRLINSQTLKVDLTGCLLYCDSFTHLKESSVEMLLNVLENAPNLEELTIGECSNMKFSSTLRNDWSMKLSQLRKLKSLKISSSFVWFQDIDQLLNVCRHLPNLQVMWVSVYEIPEGRELNRWHLKRCFPSLIVHYIKGGAQINKMKFKNLETLLDELCCRNAEKLKVYQSESKVFSYEIRTWAIIAPPTRRTIYTGSPGNFRRVSIEMMKGANELHGDQIYKRYYEDDWEEPPDRMVPVDEIKDSQEASRFNFIRFVDGGRCFSEALETYHASCWRNVRTFTIEDLSIWKPELQLEISLIAKRFPNLERLIIKEARIVNDPALKVTNLSSLRELQLDAPQYDLRHQPTPLSTIFSVAPNLERARVNGTVSHFFTVEDLKVVTSMIANGTILRKLKKLQIELRAVSIIDQRGDEITNKQIPEENIERVIKLLKTASAFLQRLTEIKLTTMDSWGEKIRFSRRKRNSKGIFWPTDSDSIFDRHRFNDFLDAFQ